VDLLEQLRVRLRSLPCGDGSESHSAVVVPLRMGPRGLEVLFELRPMHLSRSPGEISFPGGRVEPEETLLEAALRELEEELGVPSARVEVLGRLPTHQRRRGEFVHPFVCLLEDGIPVVLQETEVEEVFSVPVEELLQREFGQARIVEEYSLSEEFPVLRLPGGRWGGRQERPVYFFGWDRYLIWGLTASILRDLLELLRPGSSPGIFGEQP